MPERKHIVISAVNIRRGGTLTVLKDCLHFLSGWKEVHVTALVHNQSLCDFPGIDYMEIPWSIDSWGKRLKCEYRTMKGISDSLPEADLWLSLHDTTPLVKARRQAVYCQTSFPFLKVKFRDFLMDKKIPLFALFTKYAYKLNVRRNKYLIVQQDWLREGLSNLLHVDKGKFIVAPPQFAAPSIEDRSDEEPLPVFLYPAAPDCHKNFETVCKAAELLEKSFGRNTFRLILSLKGNENTYASWLHKKWGHVSSIDFHGYMGKEELYDHYRKAACLLFPSRVETWGLPISEFKPSGKPMILSDLPYAHETASGAEKAAFVPVCDEKAWARQMEFVIQGKTTNFVQIMPVRYDAPYAPSWEALFEFLLRDESTPAR